MACSWCGKYIAVRDDRYTTAVSGSDYCLRGELFVLLSIKYKAQHRQVRSLHIYKSVVYVQDLWSKLAVFLEKKTPQVVLWNQWYLVMLKKKSLSRRALTLCTVAAKLEVAVARSPQLSFQWAPRWIGISRMSCAIYPPVGRDKRNEVHTMGVVAVHVYA